MDYKKKLMDAIAALMVSYSIMAVMCYLSLNFLSTLYSAIFLIGGLATALVLLFIGKDNKRNTRIASICCNSVAIGTLMSMILKVSEETIGIKEILLVSAIFVGIIFVIYDTFSKFENRLPPALFSGAIVLILFAIYLNFVINFLSSGVKIFVFLHFVLLIIHYITALVVVKSSSKSIIDGMSYGYFGMTLAILVVLGIFLLIASDGDVDPIDLIDCIDIADDAAVVVHDSADFAAATRRTSVHQNSAVTNSLYYMTYLQMAQENLTNSQLLELNELEKQYREGALTKAEYERKLDKYK